MANHLPFAKKALVLSSLVEGNSIRSTERICNVNQNTIMKLLVHTGEKAALIHDIYMRELELEKIQADEIWCYVAKKQRHLQPRERNNPELGDQWIFVALDADTKLVPTYLVGKRNSRSTYEFVKELALRVKNRFQLSTDAFPPYLDAVDRVFGAQIDYAQLHKRYGFDSEAETRYSPAKIIGINIIPRIGKPVHKNISTSFVERQNLPCA